MIEFTDFQGTGPEFHFLHANGYPPACYLPLIDLIKEKYHVTGMHLRPLWPGSKPSEISSWHPFSEDFRNFLAEQNFGPIIAAGHSLGAVISLRAALKYPSLFRALILIDPVIFSPRMITSYRLINAVGLSDKFHPWIKGALRRRRKFDNLDALFNAYRRKSIFHYFSDESLWAYIHGIAKPSSQGGFELTFSPEWEAQIYHTGIWPDMDLWKNLPSLSVPTLIIRGSETDTFLPAAARRIKRIRPEIVITSVKEATHLVPLEKPQETFDIIQNFLATHLK